MEGRDAVLPTPPTLHIRLPGKEKSNSHGARPVHLHSTLRDLHLIAEESAPTPHVACHEGEASNLTPASIHHEYDSFSGH